MKMNKKNKLIHSINISDLKNKRKNVKLHIKINNKKYLFHNDVIAYLTGGKERILKESGISKQYFCINLRDHYFDEVDVTGLDIIADELFEE